MTEGDGYLARFIDGPMSTKGNIQGVLGPSAGSFELGRDAFGWPLPDRMGILTHAEAKQVAFWDADDPRAAELPDEIIESPNAVVYRKVSQSQLDEDVPGVMRGALYELEARN